MEYRLVINPNQIRNGWAELTSSQQHYLRRVLRLKDGDSLIIMNGRGQSWQAQLENTSVQLSQPLQESRELSFNLTLMVALPKGNGFEEIVRCCTELGVNTFVPIISERTILKPSQQKLERWRRIATEAAEQSERQIVPLILNPLNIATALTKVNKPNTQGYICVTRRESSYLLTHLQNSLANNLIILTGPEGGWTTHEEEQAIALGWQPVSLGHRILRAITAPIAAVSVTTAMIETRTFSE